MGALRLTEEGSGGSSDVGDVSWVVPLASFGAAKGTQTRLEKEIVAGTYERLHNKTLSKVIQKNLEQVGGVIYDARERKLAEELAKATGNPDSIVNQAAKVEPLAEFPEEGSGGSSDVGDVSWVVPLASFGAATFVPGSPGHLGRTWLLTVRRLALRVC